jgi:2-methylisocitrate lyase-like PEP mutase family enzyme
MSEKTNRREFMQAGLSAGVVAAASPLVPATVRTLQTPPQAPPRSPGAKLRSLLDSGETFEHVAAYDVLTARMVELFGFPSIYIGGSAMAEFYGEPGWALTTMSERVEFSGHIASRVNIPCVADIDEGYAPLDLYRNTKEFERVGLAGIHFGDRRALAGINRGLYTEAEMIDLIHASVDARSEMLVTVRLQGFNEEGMERTLERGRAYAEAGADVLWFVPFDRIENQRAAAAAIDKPLMAQLFYDQPVSLARDNRVTMAVYASLVQNIAQSAVYDALTEFKETGTWTNSAKGQRLGNTIPAEFRQKVLQQADHVERRTRYNQG